MISFSEKFDEILKIKLFFTIMDLSKKAYYTLLRRQWQIDPGLSVPPWQVENLRDLSTHALFQRLEALGISLSEETFQLYAENADTPEDLAGVLCPKEEIRDPAYLLLFELWRRLLPDHPTVSILCDEFDQRVDLYEKDPQHQAEAMQHILQKLEQLLTDSIDAGEDPKTISHDLKRFIAHDFETVLYRFVSDLIISGQNWDAADLIESFNPYLVDQAWFDFARARILSETDLHEANVALKSILEELQEAPDLDLLLEMATFLTAHGDPHLFLQAVRQALDLLDTEEDLQEVIAIIAKYCQCCDLEKQEAKLKKLYMRRKTKDLASSISRSDADLAFLDQLCTADLLPDR